MEENELFGEAHEQEENGLFGRMHEAEQLNLCGVVESFYCNQDDGEYNNNPCSEQCIFCKETEALQ
tara:strand:+ start:346 stop:543 length:198 start_codon:yes stop_codon:yes gene_type:complete